MQSGVRSKALDDGLYTQKAEHLVSSHHKATLDEKLMEPRIPCMQTLPLRR